MAAVSRLGIVHGGVYSSLAESLCSAATYGAVRDDGLVAMGQSNDTTFLRPISDGHANARARSRHRGRTTWVWDVDVTDDEGRLWPSRG
jgi:1,4-dihydroxy-2-naphthoyl-CoA hydrolase